MSMDAQWRCLMERLQRFFVERDVRAYIVGGAVRDLLLGRPIHDMDVAAGVPDSKALPLARDLAQALGGTLVVLDDAHQVARVVPRGEDAAGLWVDIAPLRGPVEADLRLRDFTVNAMALPLEAAASPDPAAGVVDPTGGRRDLERRVIRLVSGDALRADPARLLRAVRLAAVLGFAIDPETAEQIRVDAPLLASVPGERVADELLTALAAPGVGERLRQMDSLGLLTRVFPELEEGRGCEQPPAYHYYDVFQHNLVCTANVEGLTTPVLRDADPAMSLAPWDDALAAHFAEDVFNGHRRGTVLRLAGLLHDVAKPRTRAPDSTGRIRFLRHAELGAEMAVAALRRLRVSRRVERMVETVVRHHLRPMQMAQGTSEPTQRAVARYMRDLGDVADDTLFVAMADYLAARGPRLDLEEWRRFATIMRRVHEVGVEARTPRRGERLVSGHDLMDTLGLSPGPRLGRILGAVLEAQAAGEVRTREQALAYARTLSEREEP